MKTIQKLMQTYDFTTENYSNFKEIIPELKKILHIDLQKNKDIQVIVENILEDVKWNGDEAVLKYHNQFDNQNKSFQPFQTVQPVESLKSLQKTTEQLKQTFEKLKNTNPELIEALELATQRIKNFHQQQLQDGQANANNQGVTWFEQTDAHQLGYKVTPLDSVAVYVPGGKAAYPSSVLMTALIAKIAGVKRVVMICPQANEVVQAAAYLAQVDELWEIGGAQAVGSVAYGTETIAKVDKIVGPGNAFVAEAKRQVFGTIGIDMIAGPSEILILNDGTGYSDWVAMDLFSQAEHDELAQSILITTDAEFLQKTEISIEKLLLEQPRKDIITTSLKDRGALILAKDNTQMLEIANYIAAEHVELHVANPQELMLELRHAGAIFMGYHTTESLGDYCAGPSHVLPTSSTARFSSPLGIYDFQKRTSLLNMDANSVHNLAKTAKILADSEGLNAHAQAALMRMNSL